MNAGSAARIIVSLTVTFPLLGACSAGSAAGSPNGSSTGGGTFVPSTGATANAGGDTTNLASGGAGNTASGGGDTATGSSGSVAHDPKLFAWPEGVGVDGGGGGGLCRAGHYVGTYSCTVHGAPPVAGEPPDAGPVIYSLQGPVDMVLQQGQSGEFLSVSGGTLNSAAGFLAMQATIDGTLNCQNGAFDGTLLHGSLNGLPEAFGGKMQSTFSASGPTLTGRWQLFGEGLVQGYSCAGPWSAKWQAN
jgi:hypothetical protein